MPYLPLGEGEVFDDRVKKKKQKYQTSILFFSTKKNSFKVLVFLPNFRLCHYKIN